MNRPARQPEKSPRPSVPSKGHVVARAAERIGSPLRSAVQSIKTSLTNDAVQSLFRMCGIKHHIGRTDGEQVAWHIATRWILANSLGACTGSNDLEERLRWFDPALPEGCLSDIAIGDRAAAWLNEASSDEALGDLFPYALDPHGPGDRLSVRRDPETAASRKRKRTEGVFYTPSDVADYMVGLAVGQLPPTHPITFLDPACGTGVYLRAALASLRRRHVAADPLVLAEQSLFGMDIDPWAVDAAAYVLTFDVLAGGSTKSARHIWSSLRANLRVQDALLLDGPSTPGQGERVSIEALFPKLAKGARIVVGNPPYAALSNRSDLIQLTSAFSTLPKATSSADMHPLFVEQMVRLSAETASGCMVIPLSVAFNSRDQFRAFRALIGRTGGQWRFSFFDREPHALFGEDVKTRNTIVSWSRQYAGEPTRISTGPLQKWRGSDRATLFQKIRFAELHCAIEGGIPKLADPSQVEAFEAFACQNRRLVSVSSGITSCRLADAGRLNSPTVLVAGTAYNFLNVFQAPPSWVMPDGKLTDSALTCIHCATQSDADAIYALLSSRVAFWLWFVSGDGFHVTRQFVQQLPSGPCMEDPSAWQRLAELGSALWARAKLNPLVSNNAGRSSLAFPLRDAWEIGEVDDLLLRSVGVDPRWRSSLSQFVDNVISAKQA